MVKYDNSVSKLRDNSDRKYNEFWLQYDSPQPMYDNSINKFYEGFYKQSPVHIPNLDRTFKLKFKEWLENHEMSTFDGIDAFERLDVINGCTHYIDDLYQRLGPKLRTLEGDYKYHWRLNNNINYFTFDQLLKARDEKEELLISMPFPKYCDAHADMNNILDACLEYNIPVHIDGAWISCCKDIKFNFDHPAIKTFAVSLSKGGLGCNRIGVRFAREAPQGAVTIMNDFWMHHKALMWMGIQFISEFGPEYFWKTYEAKYSKVCKDFNLEPTKAIHLARKNGGLVGVRPLLRALS